MLSFDVHQLLAILALHLVGMFSPGPDLFLITRISIRSRTHAFAAVAGITVGIVLWVSLTVLGAAALLRTYPAILSLIQIIGGVWIGYMGVSMLRSARTQFAQGVTVAEDAHTIALLGTPAASFRQGLLTNLSNPKAVIYFSAIIAPLMPQDPSVGAALVLIVALTLTTWLGFSALAGAISTNRMRRKFHALGPWIDLIAGLFFCVASVGLLYAGISAMLT